MPIITTFSGEFDFARPVFNIKDIAHALGNQCRFNGHCKKFYSVAEHSFLVSRQCQKMGCSIDTTRFALLHDAIEAYLSDLPAPVKREPNFDFFRRLEGILSTQLCLQFKIPWKNIEKEKVHLADLGVLRQEAEFLLHPVTWHRNLPQLPQINIACYAPEEAERLFLIEWKNLEDAG